METGSRTSLFLKPKTEACVLVIFGFWVGLVVFLLEKNVYCLAWGLQSTIVSFGYTILFVIIIPIIQLVADDGTLWWLIYLFLACSWILVGILMLYNAWTKGDSEEFWQLPFIGKFAWEHANKRAEKKAQAETDKLMAKS
ncbi:hypothetical protein Pelo_3878 [Pelomyxa schiedti]|nr:hypothetical protein Pelo_3878 [Pelomyxa schiedti]